MDVPSTEAEVAEWSVVVTARWGRHRTWERERCTAASFAFHGLILVIFFLMPPRPPSLTLELLPPADPIAHRLVAQERAVEKLWIEEAEGRGGARHDGEQGAMGSSSREEPSGRYAIEGHAPPNEARMSARGATADGTTTGVLGVLAGLSAWNSPTSPFVSGPAEGADPMSALGALAGDQIGEGFGFGGLGLRGVGRGGGGAGLGTIGNGTIGTIGHGAGDHGTGFASGYGAGVGGFRGRQGPIILCRLDISDARGSLSREVVRRVVRRHLNELSFCYQQELDERPDLEGRVTVSFVVASSGRVQTSAVSSSTLGNARVEQCVASAVRRWPFPESGGPTAVTYPLAFERP